jgi:S-DNA-T family DNA segregation ATPase FtsK/SpoIIIE
MTEDGNLLVVGIPGSGRTSFLLTLLAGLARSSTPDQVHFHLVDFGGHQLRAAFSRLPHVAGTYEPGEEEAVRRLLVTLTAELEKRHELFAASGVVSLDGYHRAHRDSPPLPAILTAIHNVPAFLEAYSEEVTGWLRLVREGAAYGIYFALTADRVPLARLTDLIQTRIALRLSDHTMYTYFLGSRPDLTTFEPLPGRGFLGTKPPLEMQVALPASTEPESQIPPLQEMAEKMRHSWEGPRPSAIRMLPDQVPLAEVLPARVLDPLAVSQRLATWIGLDDLSVEPVRFDLEKVGPYFLVTGPPESGRTTALATIALALASTQKLADLRMAVVGPGRAERVRLDALAALPHTLGFGKTEATIGSLVSTLEGWVGALSESDASTRHTAPHLLLIIDDYHMIAGRMAPGLVERLEAIARRGVEQGITTIVSVPSTMLSGIGDALIRHLKSWRTGLWLRSTEGLEASALGLRIPAHLRRKSLPPGRGFLYTPADQILLQVATPELKSPSRRDMPGTIREWMSVIVALRGEPG